MSPSQVVKQIGYGHDAALNADYWLLGNSWSPRWGEDGFFRLYKTVPATCGLVWPTVIGERDGMWGVWCAAQQHVPKSKCLRSFLFEVVIFASESGNATKTKKETQ